MTEAPVHAGHRGDACDLAAEVPLQRRCPWHEAETESIVYHRETPGGKRETLAVDAGRRARPPSAVLSGQPGFGGKAFTGRRKLALAEGVEQVARKQHALTLPPRQSRR